MRSSLPKSFLLFTFLILVLRPILIASAWARPLQEGQIALIQYNGDIHFGDYPTNRKNLLALAQDAVTAGANIILMPEGSTWGYASADELWCLRRDSYRGKTCQDIGRIAEKIPGGPTTLFWENFARKNNIYVIFHVPEKDGNSYFNSIGVVGPSGLVAKYRKRMLYWVDQAYATAGRDPVVFDTPFGKFGLMICMDALKDGTYFDEYKRMGVQAILLSTDWDQDVNSPTNAKDFFMARARKNHIDIYASDVSTWDGTGYYSAVGTVRERHGLPEYPIGAEGFSLHHLHY